MFQTIVIIFPRGPVYASSSLCFSGQSGQSMWTNLLNTAPKVTGGSTMLLRNVMKLRVNAGRSSFFFLVMCLFLCF